MVESVVVGRVIKYIVLFLSIRCSALLIYAPTSVKQQKDLRGKKKEKEKRRKKPRCGPELREQQQQLHLNVQRCDNVAPDTGACHTDFTRVCTFCLFVSLFYSLIYLFIYLLVPLPHTPACASVDKGTLAFGVWLFIHEALESSCPFQTLFFCFLPLLLAKTVTAVSRRHICRQNVGGRGLWRVLLHLHV